MVISWFNFVGPRMPCGPVAPARARWNQDGTAAIPEGRVRGPGSLKKTGKSQTRHLLVKTSKYPWAWYKYRQGGSVDGWGEEVLAASSITCHISMISRSLVLRDLSSVQVLGHPVGHHEGLSHRRARVCRGGSSLVRYQGGHLQVRDSRHGGNSRALSGSISGACAASVEGEKLGTRLLVLQGRAARATKSWEPAVNWSAAET